MIVAIDGPAGAGKSTLARMLASELGFQLIETGALYRAVGLLAERAEADLQDVDRMAELAEALEVRFEFTGGRNRIYVHGEDCTDALRAESIAAAASVVSAWPRVREALLGLQRSLGRSADSVLEGRDIGTVVFPDADRKFFVTARTDVRARRRVQQLREQGREQDADFARVLADIEARDLRDRTRPTAPLRAADDAILIDTSELSTDEAFAKIREAVAAAR